MLGMEGNRKDRVIDPVKGTRPVSASAASQDAPAEQQIIECRKRNSKGESVITHRYRKGRLLGKVSFSRERTRTRTHAKLRIAVVMEILATHGTAFQTSVQVMGF